MHVVCRTPTFVIKCQLLTEFDSVSGVQVAIRCVTEENIERRQGSGALRASCARARTQKPLQTSLLKRREESVI